MAFGTVAGPTFTFGGGNPMSVTNGYSGIGITQGQTVGGRPPTAASPYQATPGGNTSTYGSTTTSTPVSGPNGPFASLGTPLSSGATSGLAAGQQALTTGFDPQNALYDQQYNLSAQNAASANAEAGLTNSPYGASQAANTANNFNINWQNTQLGREAQAMGIYDQSMSPATALYNGQYGNTSTTSGYNTQPPPPPQGGSGAGSSNGQNTSGVQPLAFPNMGGSAPSQGVPQLSSAAYQSPGDLYAGTTGQGYTGATGMMTPVGQDYNSIVNPTPQQQISPYQSLNQLTGGGAYQSDAYGNPVTNVGGTSQTADQLINPAPTDQSSVVNQAGQDYSQITSDAQASYVLAGW